MTKSCLLWVSMTWNPWVVFAFFLFLLLNASLWQWGQFWNTEKCVSELSHELNVYVPPKNASVEILTLTMLTRAARYLGDNRIWGQSPGPVISVLVYSIRELLIACLLSAGWVTRRCQQTTMQKTDLSRTPQWPQLFQFRNLWERKVCCFHAPRPKVVCHSAHTRTTSRAGRLERGASPTPNGKFLYFILIRQL